MTGADWMQRLDRILSEAGVASRKELRAMIRAGRGTVDGAAVTDESRKFDETAVRVTVDGSPVRLRGPVLILLHKPAGYLTAADDPKAKTVMDLVPEAYRKLGVMPVGRLDKDTTGFMLITDDGAFAHDILSPKKHIDKTYIATLDKPFDSSVTADFENGMTLNGEKLLKAHIEPVNGDYHIARVVLKQGLYHQVKRMFKKHSITVVELHRVAMGNLPLDENLAPGECRYLTNDEINAVKCRSGVTI